MRSLDARPAPSRLSHSHGRAASSFANARAGTLQNQNLERRESGARDGISMELRLYDTLSKEKRPFAPIDPGNVRMYVCGPTVYDFAHIGNARPVIVFDVLFRLLRHVYGADHVTYVRNITDVDDKINDRAARDFPGLPLNEAIRKVTEITTAQFHADVEALGCLPPTFEPRATAHIAEMPALTARPVTAPLTSTPTAPSPSPPP